MPMDIREVRRRLDHLHSDLEVIIKRDPDEEVGGWAVPALDGVLEEAKDVFREDDPVVRKLEHLMSPEAAVAGFVAAKDLYLIVGQLFAGLPPRGGFAFSAADRNL